MDGCIIKIILVLELRFNRKSEKYNIGYGLSSFGKYENIFSKLFGSKKKEPAKLPININLPTIPGITNSTPNVYIDYSTPGFKYGKLVGDYSQKWNCKKL